MFTYGVVRKSRSLRLNTLIQNARTSLRDFFLANSTPFCSGHISYKTKWRHFFNFVLVAFDNFLLNDDGDDDDLAKVSNPDFSFGNFTIFTQISAQNAQHL